MRYETQTVRIGERLGDVDWSYDFLSHYDTFLGNDEKRAERCDRAKDNLRKMEAAVKADKPIKATVDGGWPRVGIKEVASVGMYDGWPYWRPVPSVLLHGQMGSEWHPFWAVTEIYEATD